MNVELLRKVKGHILEEPRRLQMSTWIGKSYASPCGTVACIAGWTAILAGEWKGTMSNPARASEYKAIKEYAMEKLDITKEQANCLFYFYSWPEHFQIQYSEPTDDIVKRKAEVTAEVIEDFIKRNSK